MSGRLFGVGVGPGDPGLVTRRAWALIQGARVLAYPVLPGAESFARRIVAEAIAGDVEEIAFEVPMVPGVRPAAAAYDAGAARIAARLAAGVDVVALCEGDPFFYGSFMYLHGRLAGRFACEVVPGVSSVMACAAAAGRPLAARTGRLTVLPGPLPDTELAARIGGGESVVILKVGRHLAKIRGVIERLGLAERAIYVERATLAEERVLPLGEAPDPAPYFSMILVTGGAEAAG